MCSSFSGCKENWVLKNNASEIEGNTVEQCCSCNGTIYKGDCYEDLDSDYTSVGTINAVYSWEVAYYKYNLEFQCGNESLCYEMDYYCKIKPVQFYKGGKMILEKGDINASYNHIWCGQDLGTLKVQKIFGNGLAGIILPANILFVIGAKVVMIFAARAEAAIIDV
ncbi:MAG: hypothetical protein ACI352_00440 [Elusimicrobiaceae bacterium]